MAEVLTEYQPVYVQWLDAASETGYVQMRDTAPFSLAAMETVGWLLEKREDVLLVAQTVGVGNVGDVIIIPRNAVVSFKFLIEGEGEGEVEVEVEV